MNATAPKPGAEILRLLVAGKTAQQAADLSGWPRHRVVVLIQSTQGWLLDPDKDTVYQPDNPGMVPRLPDGIPPTAPRLPERAPTQPAEPALVPTIEALLAEAERIDDKTIGREVGKVRDGIDRLRELVASATERRQVAEAITALEHQLADARERAKALGVRKSTSKPASAPAGGPSTAEIRVWAAEHGIECSARGKIPTEVREAYDARDGDQ